MLELFAGIGGLSLGLERAGFTTVGQVELDPFCRSVLDQHWPEVPKHDDVRTAPDWWLRTGGVRPVVDVVAGGPPCQGHSVAGRQRGTADERWSWPWFRDVVVALEAPLVLIENVPNLVRTGLSDILGDLADLGFDAWWNRVPAAALGAPHLRWRLFLVAAHPERVELRHEPGRGGGTDGQGPTVVGHDGATWSLADASRQGLPQRAVQGSGATDHGHRQGLAVAGRAGRAPGARLGDWPAEPDVGRVVDGSAPRMDRSVRVDRIRALGNACVPAVGEYVGRLLFNSVTSIGRAVDTNAA